MKRIFGILLLTAVMTIPALAVSNVYLQVDGIAGTATDATHKDWMPVSEILDNTMSPAGLVGLVVNKPVDANSGALYKDCLIGKAETRALLDVSKDGLLLCRITLTNPTISQIKPRSTKKDDSPLEELTFSFRSINWEFYGPDGKVTTRCGWDNTMKRFM